MELIFFVCGIVVGVFVTTIVSRMRRAGTLVIWAAGSDEPPYMSIDLDQNIPQIAKRKYVSAKVEVRNLNTRG